MGYRGAFIVQLLLAVVGLSAGQRLAIAGAWTQDEGHGLVIAQSLFSGSTQAFDATGRLIPVSAWRKFELGFYVEYGLADGLTLIAHPSFDDIALNGPPAAAARGLEAVEAGARARLAQFGDLVFSAQALVSLPGASIAANPALQGQTAREVEARLLAGYSFRLFERDAFANGEVAWRGRDGGNPGEARVDLTLGVRLIPRLQALLQSFNAATTGGGTLAYPAQRWSKAQASLVYDFDGGWSAQAGPFGTIAAVNARRELGGLVAIWKRF